MPTHRCVQSVGTRLKYSERFSLNILSDDSGVVASSCKTPPNGLEYGQVFLFGMGREAFVAGYEDGVKHYLVVWETGRLRDWEIQGTRDDY